MYALIHKPCIDMCHTFNICGDLYTQIPAYFIPGRRRGGEGGDGRESGEGGEHIYIYISIYIYIYFFFKLRSAP